AEFTRDSVGGRARTNFGTDFDADGINLNGECGEFLNGNGNGSADGTVTLQTSCRYASYYYWFKRRRRK
ncbi:hypothetical protein NL529_30865, partial [Klebsiella pneumoniae]|nr:hypothetical protein [Klebsiella pneumoniae]